MAGMKERIIAALDVETYKKASDLVDILREEIDVFKVGIAPFTAFGERILEKISSAGKKVFLDLKVHDIPNTARNAARAAAEKEVFMMNFHCLGGEAMLRAAREGADSVKGARRKPILLGVTVLTSMDKRAMEGIGLKPDIDEQVIKFASLAKNCGFDGVVASAMEAGRIKEKFGKDFIVVTPGIRPSGAPEQDQKRTSTPSEAFRLGSDYIVVGRPIVDSPDPAEAARNIIREIKK
ncbi:MAG TPA: orotidine-5'-phosphate decarboxylase [Candidatus Omnitrophota bacterium]|nr:orotidine-5'-phosphate decarboxylase [Candidatus Omnitrophota bacterium]